MAYSMRRIEILLSYIRDKKNFKNRNSLLPLVQCFKTTFYYIFSMFQDYYLFYLVQCFKTFLLSYTQNFLHFHSPFSVLLFYIHMSTALHVM